LLRENTDERIYTMNNIVGLAILALGIVLLIFGFNESHSFTSDVSRTFTGNPTDRSMWLIVGGAVAVIAGIAVALTGRRRG
jgi:multisubunit Na+/H+ antiporter MnhB subunit